MKTKRIFNRKGSNLILSVVALIEVLLIAVVSTFAWVETASTIKISGNGVIDNYTYTDAEIGSTNYAINLADYVRESGDFHFGLASSADGKVFYFPKVDSMTSGGSFRKGNVNDKNVNYLSFSLKIKSPGAERAFVFADSESDKPKITIGGTEVQDSSVRIAISDGDTTGIYSFQEVIGKPVPAVSMNTNVHKFSDYSQSVYQTNKKSLFTVPKDGEKVITISIWIQYDESKATQYAGKEVKIEKLKIVPIINSTDSKVTVSCDTTKGSVTAQSGSESGTSITVAEGSSVTIKATPKDGYQFVAWHKGTSASDTKVDGAGESYTFTAGASQTYNYYAEFAVVTTKRIYFVNNDNWSTVNCYAWNSSGNNGTWPGVAMTDSGETNKENKEIYYIDLPVSKNFANVIFNNGSSQTDDLTIPTDGKNLYDKKNNTWRNYSEYMEEQNVTNTTRRIYFTNNWNWSSVYCYEYIAGTETNNGAWPGVQMTYLKNNEFNQGIYYVDIPTNFTAVVFNNNSGSQSVDTTLGSENAYYINGSNGEGKATLTAYNYTP